MYLCLEFHCLQKSNAFIKLCYLLFPNKNRKAFNKNLIAFEMGGKKNFKMKKPIYMFQIKVT